MPKKKQVFYVKRWKKNDINEDSTGQENLKEEKELMLQSESMHTPMGSAGGGMSTISQGFNVSASTPQNGYKPPPKHSSKNSVKLKFLMKNGLMNEDVQHKMDMDRIKEEEEDFLTTDRRRVLAIESYKM